MTRFLFTTDQTPEQIEAENRARFEALKKQRAEFDADAADDSLKDYRPGDEPPAWMIQHQIEFLRALKGGAPGKMFITSLNNEQKPPDAPWDKRWKAHERLIDPDDIGAPMELAAFLRRHGGDDRGFFVSPQPINDELALSNQALAEAHNKAEAAKRKTNPKHTVDRWSTSLRQKGHIAAIASIVSVHWTPFWRREARVW